MGFDCTLHVVDEKWIREEFVRACSAVPIERVLDAPRHRASDGRKIRKPG